MSQISTQNSTQKVKAPKSVKNDQSEAVAKPAVVEQPVSDAQPEADKPKVKRNVVGLKEYREACKEVSGKDRILKKDHPDYQKATELAAKKKEERKSAASANK